MSGIDLIAEERDEAKAERDAAWDRVAVLERQLAATREHALPLTPTPYTGPATGVDLVDRLRGIYVVPVVGERRFDASAINLEAADRISELAEHAAALGLATARIRELEGERDELLVFARDIATDAPDDPEDCALLIEVGTGEERCIVERGLRARAIVARIEKATKGTTP